MTAPAPTAHNWRPGALKAFEQSLETPIGTDDGGGKHARPFAQGLTGVNAELLPVEHITRSEVFALAKKPSVGTVTVAAAAMAWGGMHLNYRDTLFGSPDKKWLEVAESYRAGHIHRQTAYAQLRALRAEGGMKGAGPAYFTKLIYFLTPRDETNTPQGYIMDQWAGCSINLLLGRELVLMNVTRTWKRTDSGPEASSSSRVSDVNTDADYEAFCVAVDALAAKFKRCPDQIDRALLATGGKKPTAWRKYVIEHRAP
ncbi:MAG: hypothetical protein ACI9ZM_001370 [Paracoccaceae bacterium]|jgi:hypothetical protein